jgi:hypothetical protein
MLPEKIVKIAGIFIATYIIATFILKKSDNCKIYSLVGAGVLTYYYSWFYLSSEDKFITEMQSYLDYYKDKKYKNYYYLHKNATMLSFLYSIKSDSPIYTNMVNKVIKLEKSTDNNQELIKEILNHGIALNLSKQKMNTFERLMAKYYGITQNPEPSNLRESNMFYY